MGTDIFSALLWKQIEALFKTGESMQVKLGEDPDLGGLNVSPSEVPLFFLGQDM